ncbi:MAG: helix-turn-helix domain-containing protein [Oscillospiraceae bacterium]|nr:helix-turn-helix domain-containing protein [Oscillospiraceae bacterium]
MDAKTIGQMLRTRREAKAMTQSQLAQALSVSDKAVSRWETGRGFPDFTLLSPIAEALGISISELMQGECVTNRNVSGNVMRAKFYVCPNCGNILFSMGECVMTCCGMTLPPLEVEDEAETDHALQIERVEDDYYVTAAHPMEKSHFLSFLAFVTDDNIQLTKLYPEGAAQARFPLRRDGLLYAYCNRHGLIRLRISPKLFK